MPKFLYTILLTNILSWAAFFRIIFTKTPNTTNALFIFLILFGLSTFLTTSVFSYFLKSRQKHGKFHNPRLTYRQGLKFSLILSLGLSTLLGLRLFKILNLLTGSIFLLLFVSVLMVTTSNRR
ncbi:hypothetical protein GF360_01130 [candidate division WWE3 bacterium]|nr:hypothetical protein [candidate division WWE3 bacterium]